jgi:succinate dehydrogenase flavin-adding protein (antitoxin of CptAB toxin-antitoxin module)
MKELDLLLLRYMEERFLDASDEHREAFIALLEAPDPLIYAYCLAQQTPPTPVLSTLITQITEGSAAP